MQRSIALVFLVCGIVLCLFPVLSDSFPKISSRSTTINTDSPIERYQSQSSNGHSRVTYNIKVRDLIQVSAKKSNCTSLVPRPPPCSHPPRKSHSPRPNRPCNHDHPNRPSKNPCNKPSPWTRPPCLPKSPAPSRLPRPSNSPCHGPPPPASQSALPPPASNSPCHAPPSPSSSFIPSQSSSPCHGPPPPSASNTPYPAPSESSSSWPVPSESPSAVPPPPSASNTPYPVPSESSSSWPVPSESSSSWPVPSESASAVPPPPSASNTPSPAPPSRTPCQEPPAPSPSPAGPCVPNAGSYNVIFLTPDTYTGAGSGGETYNPPESYQGRDAFDRICRHFARQRYGNGEENSFRAVLSTSYEDVKDRFAGRRGPVYIAGGSSRIVVEDLPDLFEAENTQLISRIVYDAEGNQVESNSSERYHDLPWTGSTTDGRFGGASCNDWTSENNNVGGDYGWANARNSEWISYNTAVPGACRHPGSIYCLGSVSSL